MIYHGCYTQVLGSLPDNSVQLILTDPPYGINYKSTFGIKIKNDQHFFSYHELGALAYQKLQDGGVLLAFTGWSTLPKHYLEIETSGLTMQPWFTLQKSGKCSNPTPTVVDNCERAIFATKGNYRLEETQLIRNKESGGYRIKGIHIVNIKEWKRKIYVNWFGDEYPYSTVASGKSKTEKHHPHEKTVQVGEWLIKLFTKPGDTVCDPFCGSGAFMEAARNTGRLFVGGDIDKEWADYSYRRLFCNG